MRFLMLVGLVVVSTSTCAAQESAPGSKKLDVQGQEQAAPATQPPSEPEGQLLTIPAGTQVPLTLANPIRSRLAHPGDVVRAVTAFPVAVGTQVAIPAGSYVEGVIDKVIKGTPSRPARLQMHFTRIFFASGYSIPLDGVTAEAKRHTLESDVPASVESRSGSITGLAMGFQQVPMPPPLPPLPKLGPSAGEVVGIALGATAAVAITALLIARSRGVDTYFEAGFPFVMVFQTPLSLDLERVGTENDGGAGGGK